MVGQTANYQEATPWFISQGDFVMSVAGTREEVEDRNTSRRRNQFNASLRGDVLS